ncbi:MAG: energy-coupling factor transporter transmembrane component T family protein [Chitinispirillaceae bacterium]
MLLFRAHARSSIVHRLHPFTKMAISALCTFCSLAFFNWHALAIVALWLLSLLALARFPLKIRAIVYAVILLAIMTAVNFAACKEWQIALGYTLRISIFMMTIPLLAATTRPSDLSTALGKLPLPHGLVVAIMLVWRFFPVLADEVGELRKAQLLRGTARVQPLQTLYRGFLVPIAFMTIEYSERITLALELRGFTPGAARTSMRQLYITGADTAISFATVALVGIGAWIQWGGPL